MNAATRTATQRWLRLAHLAVHPGSRDAQRVAVLVGVRPAGLWAGRVTYTALTRLRAPQMSYKRAGGHAVSLIRLAIAVPVTPTNGGQHWTRGCFG